MRAQPGDGSKGLERVSRHGRLYNARGGTIYLQNGAEAPTRVQARLARLLRDREATLSETGETTNFDVRPMAGVDPAFETAVQDGRVRDDLFRRLSVIRIEMPPLRSRREDIPALANYFLREICAGLRVPRRRPCRGRRCRCSRRCRGAAPSRNCGGCSTPSSPACRAGAASRSRTSWLTSGWTAAPGCFERRDAETGAFAV